MRYDNAAVSRDALDAMLAAWIASITTPQLVLFNNPLAPDPLTPFSAMVEPTASWYTRAALVLGSVFYDPAYGLRVVAESVQYSYGASVSAADTIYGYGIVKHVAGPPIVDTLLAAFAFATPVTLAGLYDALVVEPSFSIPLVVQR